jgi:hypothetical protein
LALGKVMETVKVTVMAMVAGMAHPSARRQQAAAE